MGCAQSERQRCLALVAGPQDQTGESWMIKFLTSLIKAALVGLLLVVALVVFFTRSGAETDSTDEGPHPESPSAQPTIAASAVPGEAPNRSTTAQSAGAHEQSLDRPETSTSLGDAEKGGTQPSSPTALPSREDLVNAQAMDSLVAQTRACLNEAARISQVQGMTQAEQMATVGVSLCAGPLASFMIGTAKRPESEVNAFLYALAYRESLRVSGGR